MKIFSCQQCGQTLLFENTQCQRCGVKLGYLPASGVLSALLDEGESYKALADADATSRWVYCSNAAHRVCNWLLPAGAETTLCECCELNRHIPDLADPGQQEAWQELEFAKHRLVYSLHRFGLPIQQGLRFDFISTNRPIPPGATASTGHASGQVTITTDEADSAEREQHRVDMDEPYRTLIGHFRHEVGHYYWEQLLQTDPQRLQGFRDLFGDDTLNYQQALQQHYEHGPAANWQAQYISAYASSHPWEDWAETWAHYFHLVDTLETAHAFGLSLQPQAGVDAVMAMTADIDPYVHKDFDELLNRALPLTFAVNSLNRSMGQPDLYPFVLSSKVKDKLRFIHNLLLEYR